MELTHQEMVHRINRRIAADREAAQIEEHREQFGRTIYYGILIVLIIWVAGIGVTDLHKAQFEKLRAAEARAASAEKDSRILSDLFMGKQYAERGAGKWQCRIDKKKGDQA